MILSSRSSMLTPSFFHDMVGSGCPRGGWHSRTAGSPAATITSAGFCLKSSRKTAKNEKEEGREKHISLRNLKKITDHPIMLKQQRQQHQDGLSIC